MATGRKRAHRPQAASISHPILLYGPPDGFNSLRGDVAAAVASISGPTSASTSAMASSSNNPVTAPSSATAAAASPLSISPSSPNSRSPSAGMAAQLSPETTLPLATAAYSRLTPSPLQPLAPTPTYTMAASTSPRPSSSFASLQGHTRAASTSQSGLSRTAPDRRNVGLEPSTSRDRIRVTSRDGIELAAGSSSRPSASLSLRQASSTQRRPFALLSAGAEGDEATPSASKATAGPPPDDYEVHPTFRADSNHRGSVLVRVQGVDFYVHEDILRFSSPFFESLLTGGWKESRLSWTNEEPTTPEDGSPAEEVETTIDQQIQAAMAKRANKVRASFVTAYTEFEEIIGETSHTRERSLSNATPASETPPVASEEQVTTVEVEKQLRRSASEGSLPQPQSRLQADDLTLDTRMMRLATPPDSPQLPRRSLEKGPDLLRPAAKKRRERLIGVTAVLELHEETASTFQDFLFYIYPHLDVQITWLSCGSLLAFSDKIGAPFLHKACLDFLRASLAGKPIEAMRLAEYHHLPDVYKEASRHVLDNWTVWQRSDLEVLSAETLLKLERRRSWFLERVLKLGLADPLRDFECHAKCSEPTACAKGLQERWQAGYAASCRFAPPKPSGVFRYLRELDGAQPLPQSACHAAAKAWSELLFDRMFNLPSLPHGGRLFLHIKLEG